LLLETSTMRSPLSYLSLLILILSSSSCTKSKPGTIGTTGNDTASIIGTWTWAYQSSTLWDTPRLSLHSREPAPPLTPANTGISRTLIFDSSGKFTIIHNDSIFEDSVNYEPNYLHIANPVLLLTDLTSETDTGFYQVGFGIVGCAITDTTTLTIQNVPYQAILTADTLLVHGNPCLSRVVDIYIRKN
jgi:hypothetical protein